MTSSVIRLLALAAVSILATSCSDKIASLEAEIQSVADGNHSRLPASEVLPVPAAPSDGSGGTGSPTPPVLPPPVAPSSGYSVYQGCDSPASSYAKDLYIDPVNGDDSAGTGTSAKPYKSLASVISKKLITSGTHVHLLPGSYGAITITGGNSSQLVANSSWVWFDFQPGALAGFVTVSGVSHLLITGLEATGRTVNKAVIDIGSGANQIVLADSLVYSATSANLTATEWLNLSNGVSIAETYCGAILRTKVRYVRFGIIPGLSGLDYPMNSAKQLMEENDIQFLSADAFRMNGSDMIFRNNRVIDGYVDAATGDTNHDDMVQGFKLDGGYYANILVEGNFFLDRSTSSRALPSEFQGVGIFDGLFKNVTVRKNIIISGAYHGIMLSGVEGALIENNTLVSTSGKTLWIGTANSKTGVAPVNVVVRNNIAVKYSGAALFSVDTNNYTVTNPGNEFVEFDLVNGRFDLNLKSTSSLYGKGAGAL